MAEVTNMKLNLPGLNREPLPSGRYRLRVRVKGKKKRKITIPVDIDHPEFMQIYNAARAGVVQAPTLPASQKSVKRSVSWLTHAFEEFMAEQVAAGQLKPATQKQRRYFLSELRADCGEYEMNIPQEHLIEIRDKNAATPGKANNMMNAIRAMYRWACERGIADTNPVIGVAPLKTPRKGATPWSLADIAKFRERHPSGTQPHLALSLFMFTACRVSDAILLGRGHEFDHMGSRWIGWTPVKKNASPVELPIAPPLMAALRAQSVIGPTYLLNSKGTPWSSTDSFRIRFKTWCKAAGLPDRSPHGIRKAAGHLLAQLGASQHEIMSVHGHDEARTSEVYTRGVERANLAASAMRRLGGIEW